MKWYTRCIRKKFGKALPEESSGPKESKKVKKKCLEIIVTYESGKTYGSLHKTENLDATIQEIYKDFFEWWVNGDTPSFQFDYSNGDRSIVLRKHISAITTQTWTKEEDASETET